MKKSQSEKFKAPNGLRFILQEYPANPSLAAAVYLKGSALAENRQNQGISYLTQKLLLKGSQFQGWQKILAELEFLGADLKTSADKDTLFAQLRIISSNLEKGLKLLAECLLFPAFAEKELKMEKQNLLIEIEKRKDDLPRYCSDLCDELVFAPHPYSFPLMGEKPSLETLKAGDLSCWHKKLFAPQNMVIALAGDLEQEKAKELILKYFGDFKATPPFKLNQTPPLMPSENRFSRKVRDKQQAVFVLGFPAPSYSSPDFIPFLLLSQSLAGMGARFFLKLREKLGLAYLVQAVFQPFSLAGVFKLFLATSKKNLELAKEQSLKEIAKVRLKGIYLNELKRAKNHLLGLIQMEKQKNLYRAGRAAFYELIGLNFDFPEKLLEKIKTVTIEEVNYLGEKYFSLPYSLAQILPPG